MGAGRGCQGSGGSVAGGLALAAVPHVLGVALDLDGGGVEAEGALQPRAGLLQHLLRVGAGVCEEFGEVSGGWVSPQIIFFPPPSHSLMAMCTESSGCAAVSAQMWRLCTASTPPTASSVSRTALKSMPLGVPGGEPQNRGGGGLSSRHPQVVFTTPPAPAGPYPP